MQTLLAQETADVRAADWKVPCLRFAPHAPEQNPTADVGRKGKTPLRKQSAVNTTLAPVQHCFSSFLTALRFTSTKFSWYWPTEQMM
jgi:hypothetical protein